MLFFFFFSLHKHYLEATVDNPAAAKSLQSCPTLCDPIDGSPLGSSVPGILQARTLEYRTGQSWFPRKLDSLELGKLVLFICNSKP